MWEKNSRHISAELDAAVTRNPVDAILMFGAEGGAFAKATIPLFCYTDSFFGARIGLCEDQPWAGLSRSSIREGVRMQQLALDRLDKLFVSSSWAIEQAGSRFGYKGIHEKCEVVSIGANLPSAPSTEDGRSAWPTEIVPFVWLGSYWRRKGGEFAVEMIGRLRESGTNAILHVVGPVQPSRSDSWIRPYGRLSYDIPEEFERLKAIYRESQALLLPTQGDTTPLVVSEAFAFGRPAITTRMGGIPEMVSDGQTGLLMEAQSATNWAARIHEALESGALERMNPAWRNQFETVLNWEAVCEKMLASMKLKGPPMKRIVTAEKPPFVALDKAHGQRESVTA